MCEKNTLIGSPLVEEGLEKFRLFIAHQFIEQALWAFAELGLADLFLNNSRTATELADVGGNWNAKFLYRLLRTSVDAGLVNENSEDNAMEPESTNRFTLTDTGRLLLSDHPSHARDMIRFGFHPFCKRASFYLPQLIREGLSKGTGAEQVIGGGRSLFDYLNEPNQRELSSVFNGTMSAYSSVRSGDIASTIDFSSVRILVDIGGNLGTLLASILLRHPSVKGIVADLSEVIEQAKEKNAFQEMNISEHRYQFVLCDAFDSSTIPQADAYILKQVLHDFDDDKCIKILQSIRQAIFSMQTNATLYIIEVVILPSNERFTNWISHGMDIYMLYFLGSQERTQQQYQILLHKGGFRFVNLRRLHGPESIIEATLI